LLYRDRDRDHDHDLYRGHARDHHHAPPCAMCCL
jgi:hypothetical protein